MNDTFGFVMTEHAAWLPRGGSWQRVVVLPDGGRWLATVRGRTLALDALTNGASKPVLDVFTLSNGLLGKAPELAAALGRLGSVVRYRNADLWDAVGTAIIRQVIRAAQSKKLYRASAKRTASESSCRTAVCTHSFPHPRLCSG
jgi:DNA-3-methyladenine glycosylase II